MRGNSQGYDNLGKKRFNFKELWGLNLLTLVLGTILDDVSKSLGTKRGTS